MNHPLTTYLKEAILDFSQAERFSQRVWDAVIIGSGAAGSVLAQELTQKNKHVLLIEQGPLVLEHRGLTAATLRTLYIQNGFHFTQGRPFIPVPIGKALGGTTVINSGTCFRTPVHILKNWQKRFGEASFEQTTWNGYFEDIEKKLSVQPASYQVMSTSNSMMKALFQDHTETLGKPLLRNIRNCEGCGTCCYGCPTLAKQSTDLSVLPKAFEQGLCAYIHAQATKVFKKGHTIKSIEIVHPFSGQREKIFSKTFILSAGTFGSASFLKKNKLTKSTHLGKHLTLHPATKVLAKLPDPIFAWRGTPQAFYWEGHQKEGIFYEGAFLPPDLAPIIFPTSGQALFDFVSNYAHYTSYGFLVEDSTEGFLDDAPFWGSSFRYQLTPRDTKRIQKGIVFLSKLFFKAGAKKVIPLLSPYRVFHSPEEVNAFEKHPLQAQELEMMAFHPLGTCRLGTNPKEGVCDLDHRVFSLENLFVCDGSSVPNALGVNPQITIMALAKRCSQFLLKKYL